MVSEVVGAEIGAEMGWLWLVLGPLWEETETSAGGGPRTGSEVGNEVRWRLSLDGGTRNRDGAGFAAEIETGIKIGIRSKVGMGLRLKLELRWGRIKFCV